MYCSLGFSVSCLGDTDGDGLEEVAVGAPYFNNTGAVFIYRARSRALPSLELSQVLRPPPGAATGFGMKLSRTKLTEEVKKKMVVKRGLAVAAPLTDKETFNQTGCRTNMVCA